MRNPRSYSLCAIDRRASTYGYKRFTIVFNIIFEGFLDVIDRNSQYMATMVKDLLQLSSIENGAVPMNIKAVPASMVLRSGTDLCRSSAESRRLIFREEMKDGDFSVGAAEGS